MVWKYDVAPEWQNHRMVKKTKRDLTDYGYTDPIDIGGDLFVAEAECDVIGDQTASIETAVFERKNRRYNIVAYAYWRLLYKTEKITVITPVMVGVSPNYRGTQIGIGLYRWMLNKPGYVIQAGDISNVQSRGGASLWWKLYDDPNYEITASRSPLEPREVKVKRPRGGYPYLSTRDFEVYDSDAILRVRKVA